MTIIPAEKVRTRSVIDIELDVCHKHRLNICCVSLNVGPKQHWTHAQIEHLSRCGPGDQYVQQSRKYVRPSIDRWVSPGVGAMPRVITLRLAERFTSHSGTGAAGKLGKCKSSERM
ncbi:hypothetical protein ACOMHN_003749 [Nucella lapillus]